ncbi:unnamed protein product (mitochondrion) [Plasmodiophora brassicae]|uniref:Acyltransferase n=1 Tax=Plasmodiophora brassicae TaxID=37360 RepID=A0A3P3YL13_PLABS|nr:unnamed protein product [Plasmodiophora brassicae]
MTSKASAVTPRTEAVTRSWTALTTALLGASFIAAVCAELVREIGLGIMDWRTHSLIIVVACVIAFLGVFLAAPLMHVIVGHRRHHAKGYRSFQPFVGGSRFIVLQIIGWTFYALAITAFVSLFWTIASKMHLSTGSVTSAVTGGVLAQLFLWLSLSAFMLTATFYSMPLLVVIAIVVPAIVLPWITYFSMMIPFAYLYSFTYHKSPHRTGTRSWTRVREKQSMWGLMEHYFSLRLIPQGKLDPDQVYMFGYHPHGIYPFTTVWATRGRAWAQHYPKVTIDVLAATVIFYLPVIRDIAMWSGCRDASRESMSSAFKQRRSVMLVPGGEREMRENRPESDEVVLVTRHKGFIRQAIIHGVSLVPVFGFGESHLLDNFRAKSTQEWFAKRTLYGAPHMPYGRFYSPIPNPAPVTVVVGDPIPVTQMDDPPADEIDRLHRVYFDALRHLFDQHKASVAGFENSRIVYPDFHEVTSDAR